MEKPMDSLLPSRPDASPSWTPPQGNSSQFGQTRAVTITAAASSDGAARDPSAPLKPNQGASVPDQQAIGARSESLADWRRRRGIDTATQIKLVKLVHMRYQHPDLNVIARFLRDFGMVAEKATSDEVWFRGYGPDQYVYYARRGEKMFLGGTFEVETRADLDRAAALPGAEGSIVDLHAAGAPGGGHLVTLRDPEGFPLNLIHGQSPAPPRAETELPTTILHNDERKKPRARAFNRFTPGPAAVHKLGHFGLCVRDFAAQLKWYTETFNMAPTDFLYVPASAEQDGNDAGDQSLEAVTTPGRDVALFAHIDRGEELVDHHTFFISTNATSHVHHASFEVHDLDTQQLGHQWLGKQGYTSVWVSEDTS